MTTFNLFLYAWKNISRQISRSSLLVGITVVLSVFALSTASLFSGKNRQIEKAIIETHQGDWQILNRLFYEGDNALQVSAMDGSLRRALSHTLYSPELVLSSTLLDPTTPSAVILLGIDEELHEKVFPLRPFLKTSSIQESPGDVIIGDALSSKLNIKEGEVILLAFQDNSGGLRHESFKVKAIYKKFGQAFEEKYIFTNKDFLADLLGLKPGSYNRIIIRGTRPDNPDPNNLVKSWKELNPELLTLMRFHDGITSFMLIFMLVMTFVSLITPLNVLWDERMGELKMLMTLGAQRMTTFKIAIFESIILCAISLVLTFGLFWILHEWASVEGIDFSNFGESAVNRGGVQLSNIIFPYVRARHLLLIGFFNLLVFVAGNLWCSHSRLKAIYK